MSVPDPVMNFRAPAPAKAALDLMAGRRSSKPGILSRRWFLDRLYSELCQEVEASGGASEVIRRLSRPSYPVHDHDHTDTENSVGSANNVTDCIPPAASGPGRIQRIRKRRADV